MGKFSNWEALLINQNETMTTKPNSKVKIIKRYQNRKLYDTQQSCYVTLDDIAKMIRANEEVMVIDNKSKNDITAATLTQIIFEAEKKHLNMLHFSLFAKSFKMATVAFLVT